MNTDDKIRAILHREADSIEPSPDGWNAIQDGVAKRRPRLLWSRGAALAGAAALFVGVTAYVAADRSRHGVEEVTSPPSTFTSAPSGQPSELPSESPPPAPPKPEDPIGAIWPLTTHAEVAAWQADPQTYPALTSSRSSGLAFARRYLGIGDAVIVGDEAYGESTLAVKRGPVTLSTLTVKGFGKDGTAPFVVIHAEGWSASFSTPRAGAALTGRFDVRGGAYEGVDSPIEVALRVDDGGSDPTAGQDVAVAQRTSGGWAVTMDAGDRTGTGSILMTVRDGGQVTTAAAVPVTFGGVPGPPVVVAARGGRIGVFAKETGEVQRWLTAPVPGAGASDPELTDDGKTVVYVQSTGNCASEIRSVPFAGGEPKTLVPGDQGRLSHPTLRGDVLAYVRGLCQAGGSQEEVVVLNNGTRLATPWSGDVVSGPVAGNRSVVFVGSADGGEPRVWVLDGLNEQAPVSAAAPGDCVYAAATWGPPDGGSGEALHVATACGGRTYLEGMPADLTNPVRLYEIRLRGVDHLDYAGPDLLVGADGAAYVVDQHDPAFRVPGEAKRPTWS